MTTYQIAAGWDNYAAVDVASLADGYREGYTPRVTPGRVLIGMDGLAVADGCFETSWVWADYLRGPKFAALLTKLGLASAESAKVTICTLGRTREWEWWNAIIYRPDPVYKSGRFDETVFPIKLVEELVGPTGFSSGFATTTAFGASSGADAGTTRTLSAILALLADSTDGDITPLVMRDLVLSTMGYCSRIRTVTASAALTSDDDLVLVDVSTGSQVITLPAAADCTGQTITVKRLNAANNFTVAPPTGDIEGDAAFTFDTQWRTKAFISTGTVWLYAVGDDNGGGY